MILFTALKQQKQSRVFNSQYIKKEDEPKSGNANPTEQPTEPAQPEAQQRLMVGAMCINGSNLTSQPEPQYGMLFRSAYIVSGSINLN